MNIKMKNIIVATVFIIMVLVTCFIPITLGFETTNLVLSGDGGGVQVSYDSEGSIHSLSYVISGLDGHEVVIDDEVFYQFWLDEGVVSLKKGFPELPLITRSLIVPDDAAMDVRVTDVVYEEFSGVSVVPSKGNLCRTLHPDPSRVPFEFGEVYGVDAWYPEDIVSLQDPYIVRDFRGQVVEVVPFQYNPVQNVLRMYSEVSVEVFPVKGETGVNVLHRSGPLLAVQRDFARIYERHFVNYEEHLNSLHYDPVEEEGNMLVICYDDFSHLMDPFVDWKNLKGIPTELVEVSTIGSTTAAISGFIEDYYHDHGLTFVLLVGNENHIPTPIAFSHASDPSYSFIVGDDYYPDLFVGRFSAATEAHVVTQVERSIYYEQNPGGDWRENATGIACNEGPGYNGLWDWEHMRILRDRLYDFGYTWVDEFYDGSQGEDDAPGNPTSAMVSAAFNEGRHIANYCGHGWYQVLSTSGYSNADIHGLVNVNMLPFFITVACRPGGFTAVDECFAEAWVRATHNGEPTGGIAAFSSARSQSWSPPMAAQDEMMHVYTETYPDNVKTSLGGIAFNGCMFMNDLYGTNGHRETANWHLFGDPSLDLTGSFVPGEPPSVTVTRPTGGEVFVFASDEEITWVATGGDDPVDYVQLFYSVNAGSSWKNIASGLPNSGSYLWSVPNEHSTQCLVRVRAVDEMGRFAENTSEAVFTIQGVPPAPPEDLIVTHISAPVMSVFDDFSDGTYDDWTVYSGSWDASHGYLEGYGSISTPALLNGTAVEAYGRWEFDIQFNQATSGNNMRLHFIQVDDPDTRYSSGYYVFIRGDSMIRIWRWDNGNTPGSPVVDASWSPSTEIRTVAVERNEQGEFSLFVDDELVGTGTDTMYTSNEYVGFRHTQSHRVHEIRSPVLGDDDDHNLLTWSASPDDPAEVTHYKIYRSEDYMGPWDESTRIDSVTADGSVSYEYIDEFAGLADDVFWWYVVRAVGKNGLEEDNEYAVQEPFDGFSLLLSTSGEGSGSIEACWLGPFYYEDEVTVWANASEGSIFEGFSGDLSGILSPQTLVITGNMSVDAAFSLQSGFTLSLSTSGDGSGSIEAAPFGPYTYGDMVTVWANASEGSVFVGFSGDLSGSSSPQVLMITGNMSVDAAFEVGVEVVDVEQELSDRGFRLMPGWDAAQEFISSYPTLSRVELYMTTWNDPVHPIPVEIRKDDPIGDVLFSSVIYPADVATSFPDWGWVSVDVGVAVEVGETYVIVLRDSADDDFNHLMWGVYTSFGAPPGPYPDGQMLFRKLGFPTWMPIWDFDCAFKTYGLI